MTAVTDVVDVYLERKAVGDPDGSGAGTYAANAESILRRWSEWLEREHDVVSLFDLRPSHMEAYARELGVRADEGEYTASTARTYYAVVRAFLSWCVGGGILETNPAATDAAREALPADDADDRPGRHDWSTEQRRALVSHVRERALEADDADRSERLARLREYAMVAVLAHSGVRGAELFRVPEDDRRTGATWGDVDFYTGTVRVLGKSQRLEDVPLPGPARTPLRRYRVVLDPPTADWPLFPTRHAPSIAASVRSALRDRGYDDEGIESLLDGATATEVARDRGIAPPAITTEGARSILKRLCEAADVEVEGDYLKPHGARPADGARRDPTTTRSTLRPASVEQSLAVVEDDGPGPSVDGDREPPAGDSPTPSAAPEDED